MNLIMDGGESLTVAVHIDGIAAVDRDNEDGRQGQARSPSERIEASRDFSMLGEAFHLCAGRSMKDGHDPG
jgi:hypothetical protein